MAMLVCRVLRPVINNDGPATAPATSDRHLAVLPKIDSKSGTL